MNSMLEQYKQDKKGCGKVISKSLKVVTGDIWSCGKNNKFCEGCKYKIQTRVEDAKYIRDLLKYENEVFESKVLEMHIAELDKILEDAKDVNKP